MAFQICGWQSWVQKYKLRWTQNLILRNRSVWEMVLWRNESAFQEDCFLKPVLIFPWFGNMLLSLAFRWIWVWCMCSHMAPLKIWFAWSNACLRYLKDLSTGGILLLKQYSKGLGFHAVHSVKSCLHAHESKAHLSSSYFQQQLVGAIFWFPLVIIVCCIYYLPLLLSKPSQCQATVYMQRRGGKEKLPLIFSASP